MNEAKRKRPVLDLRGPAGNAFVLLGHATNLAKQLGRDPAPILERMQASDYENLVQVFSEEFGEFVKLVR